MSINKIDLIEIFKKLETKYYTIIKLPEEFPAYKTGSDLDIFCFDMQDVAKIILENLQKYINESLNIEMHKMNGQMYIDIVEEDKIHFRFDLYEKLPKYYNVNIKEGFFSSVIENSKIKQVEDLKIMVPSVIDEVILRYIEYHEWYEQRPDKIKHINYIEDQIEKKGVDVGIFLDKIHFYTAVPKVFDDRKVSKFQGIRRVEYLFGMVKYFFVVLRDKGFKSTMKIIVNKIKK